MKESNLKKTYFFLQLLMMFYAVGGIFSKNAANEPFLSTKYILNYGAVLLILMIYAVFWQMILKKIPLSVAMANKSTTVIWGLVYGFLFFQEKISIGNLIGAAVIIAGIVIVVSADKEQEECT